MLIPVASVRGGDGIVRVRRVSAAPSPPARPNLASVPVYVRPSTDGDDKAEVIERVTEQIVEDDQRVWRH